MVTIILLPHGRTTDNERGVASGHNDIDLSAAGAAQASALAADYATTPVAAVLCSDLRRAVHTAALIFGARGVPIIADARLREADYGDLTQRPVAEVVHADHVTEPFPGGESYRQVMERMGACLQERLPAYDGATIVMIGHRATRYALEHWLNDVPLADAIAQFTPRPRQDYQWDPPSARSGTSTPTPGV